MINSSQLVDIETNYTENNTCIVYDISLLYYKLLSKKKTSYICINGKKEIEREREREEERNKERFFFFLYLSLFI